MWRKSIYNVKEPWNVCGVLLEKHMPHRLGIWIFASLAIGGVSFGKVWEVWPRWRDYIPWGGLRAFTALPHSQFALFALCLLLKVQAFRSLFLLPCLLLATMLACLVDSYPSAAISQNQFLLPQSFSVLVQQQKSDYHNFLREMNQVQIRTSMVRDSTCVSYVEQAIHKDSSR